MTSTRASINPFLATRSVPPAPLPQRQRQTHSDPEPSIFVKLPRAPKTASPVPHLTSLYHNAEAGNYGRRSYPGNCGGNLIKDLLLYFPARRPGVRSDVGLGHLPRRLHGTGPALHFVGHPSGLRRLQPQGLPSRKTRSPSSGPTRRTGGRKLYADDPRDLSRAPDTGGLPAPGTGSSFATPPKP